MLKITATTGRKAFTAGCLAFLALTHKFQNTCLDTLCIYAKGLGKNNFSRQAGGNKNGMRAGFIFMRIASGANAITTATNMRDFDLKRRGVAG